MHQQAGRHQKRMGKRRGAARAHIDFSGAALRMGAAQPLHFGGIEDGLEGLLPQITHRLAVERITLAAGKHPPVVLHIHRPAPQVVAAAPGIGRDAGVPGLHQIGLVFLDADLVDAFDGAPEAAEFVDFVRFWSAVPGVDQVRIKEDETNLMRPDAGHASGDWKHPCHYLWRGPMYVKHNGDVYPCCQSYMLDGKPVGHIGAQPLDAIWNSEEMQRMRRLHLARRAGEIDICSRCCTTIPHPLLVAGSLFFHGKTVRRLLPLIERLTYFSKLPRRLLNPPRPQPAREELVQIRK